MQSEPMQSEPMQPEPRSTVTIGRSRVRETLRRSRARLTLNLATGRERGDVPGWVLITLMTAGLVIALWAVAGPALTTVFVDAIARVTGQIGG